MEKAKKKRILILILAALLIVLFAWRFIPVSFSKALRDEAGPDILTGFIAMVTIHTAEQGSLQSETYEIGMEAWPEIYTILDSANYRRDFRNLIAPLLNGISVKGSDKVVDVSIHSAGRSRTIECVAKDKVFINYGDGSSCLYHPTDRSVLDKLAEYIKNNGEKK